MKTTITFLIALLVTGTATANTRQDIVRTALAGEIVSVRALCPSNVVCITNGTVVELKFQPQSACGNVKVTYKTDEENNIVDVTAIEETNSKMACIMVYPAPRLETISLIMMFPPMTLNFVGTGIGYDILPEDVINSLAI